MTNLDVPAPTSSNVALVILWVCSAVLLVFGLTRPIIQIEVNIVGVLQDALDRQPIVGLMLQEKGFSLPQVASKLPPTSATQKSIVSSVIKLYELDCYTAASLILVFSIIVPICKQLAMLLGILAVPRGRSRRLVLLTQTVHKWAMLDVFVLAMVVLGLSSATAWNAYLLDGFYWFLGYFFVAAVLGILLSKRHNVISHRKN